MSRLLAAAAWVGMLALALGLWTGSGEVCTAELPRGMTKPGLAIELARSCADVQAVLGAPAACPAGGSAICPPRPDTCRQNRETLGRQQYRDFVFIPFYVAFLVLIAAVLVAERRGLLRGMGALAIILAVAAGGFDVHENLVILDWLGPTPGCSAAPHPVAAAKWGLVFVVLALEIPVFVVPRNVIGLARWAGYGVALLALGAAVSGLAGVVLGDDAAVQAGAALVGATMLLALLAVAGYAWFPRGLLDGLDRLAARPGVRWLAGWPDGQGGSAAP